MDRHKYTKSKPAAAPADLLGHPETSAAEPDRSGVGLGSGSAGEASASVTGSSGIAHATGETTPTPTVAGIATPVIPQPARPGDIMEEEVQPLGTGCMGFRRRFRRRVANCTIVREYCDPAWAKLTAIVNNVVNRNQGRQ